MLKQIRFKDYKAFSDYIVYLNNFNILVGPNNCGKSTIIGALRLLDLGIRKAKGTQATDFYTKNGTRYHGFKVNTDTVDISTENVSHDYEKVEPEIHFHFEKSLKAMLIFLEDGSCYLTIEDGGIIITGPSQLKTTFTENIKCVPILGPLEHDEDFVGKETVLSNLNTHRASRNFRSYWKYFPKNWELFSRLINDTWPGMEIDPPYLNGKHIYLLCKENRISRELYWVGYGFQIWCQILTHISMLEEYSVIVIDEPEIYLHAEVQRQLINILKENDKQIIIATHSIEILGESNPDDVVIVDKETDRSYRIKNIDGLQRAVSLIGSIHNISLANLARTKRMLCVENMSDYSILSKLIKKYRGMTLERSGKVTPVEIEGSSFAQNVKSFSWGLKGKFNLNIAIGIILDRDCFSRESIQGVYNNLKNEVDYIHILSVKDIENFLLDFTAIAKCIIQSSKQSISKSVDELTSELLFIFEEISNSMKNYVLSQLSSNRLKTKSKEIDDSTEIEKSLDDFEKEWKDIDLRKKIVPGKKVLKQIRQKVQEKYKCDISEAKIIKNMDVSTFPMGLKELLDGLIHFININY